MSDARPRVIDISVPNLAGPPLYPGDPALSVEWVRRLEHGDAFNLCRLTLGNHTGTHVDAPAHVLAGGASLGDVPLERLIGPAVVADLRGLRVIDVAALDQVAVVAGDILLLRTDAASAHLTEDAAAWVVERDLHAVGIDAPSVDCLDSQDLPAHRRLLAAGLPVIESLDLRAAPPGRYTLVCLPLKFPALDGAPARAVLLAGVAPDPMANASGSAEGDDG